MKKILTVFILACLSCVVYAQDNVIDEIVWVVGDDAILRSDIESQRLYLQNEGQRFDGDPYCVLPEQMAIQKLFLNQAKIDSVEVSENQVIQETDRWINFAINQIAELVGTRQVVDRDDVGFAALVECFDNVGADEAGGAGDDGVHAILLSSMLHRVRRGSPRPSPVSLRRCQPRRWRRGSPWPNRHRAPA